ncbi:zeste-white 10 kinetochore protein isoform X2 [Rhodnius prolixus]|uniref:zeste-white 10 kinetochore protein isoform X2 n=1 Tax=Rhodnius prolixus TaxID=13249 RepID=UPI003D18E5A0
MENSDDSDAIDLQECLSDVNKKINLLREDVKDHMNSHYVQLQSVMSNNTNLQVQAEKLLEDVKDLQLRLDTQIKREVAALTEELKKMKDTLEESNMLVDHVNKLLIIDTELSAVQSKKAKNNSYLQIMKHLDTARKYLEQECGDIEYLDIYKTISETITLWYSDSYKEVTKAWEESVNIKYLEMDGNTKTTLLSVSDDQAEVQNILMTLSLLGELPRRISLFANSLYKEILVTITENHSTPIREIKSGSTILVVSSNVKGAATNSKLETNFPDYAQVLHNLTKAFEFLQETLDYEINEETRFLKEVGGYIGEKFITLLNESCLTHTIPRKRQELEAYSNVIKEILRFDKLLKDMQFLDSTNNTLKRYGGNIEELFLNKTIEIYLDSARTIMKKNLGEMIEIEPKEIKEEELEKAEGGTSIVLDQISLGIFQFPKCYISKSVEELVLLIKEVLKEIVTDRQINSDSALRLFSTARDMLMVFRLAAIYHKKNVENLPQQAALLYNNLMYLATKAMTLHLEFREQYPPCLVQNMALFVDLVHPLRTSAVQVLDLQVSKQQAVIVDTIKQAGFSSLSECEKLGDNTKKCLKQCLYQLSFLKNMWHGVLPSQTYCKIMGQLCYIFIEEIISNVLATKDITADTTLELAAVFDSIQKDVPSLFTEPKEVHRYVKNWTKFSELVYVLSGTLTEIEERWADGKGPLANEFTPVQLKHLIKALFQTSDRRAAVLAAIN